MGISNESGPRMGIPSFFAGKKIFITGVTGFLGSVLLEKLLRSCPGVDTVYILIRAKKGQDVKSRLENILSTELFCEINTKDRRKVVPVEGDITLPRLGISTEMEKTLSKEVQIVFHVAASTNFGSHLRRAVSTNFLGTKKVIELSEKMTNLQVFVHVSTAYCNAIVRGKIREEIYPCWIDGMELSKKLEGMTDWEIEQFTTDLLGGQPNTYAFTKHLSENLLYQSRRSVPIAVVRPSTVLSTWKEPISGWVQNVQNGGVAFIAGAGKGVFRTIMGDRTKNIDVVPCDTVANMTIAAAWDVITEGPGTFKVYHCTSGLDNPLTLGDYCDLTIAKVKEYPSKEVLWYPSAKCRRSEWRINLFIFLYHLLPAMILQLVEKCNGKNRPIIAYQQKFIRGTKFISFFTKRDWHFETRNVRNLSQKMSPEDSSVFDIDMSQINWPSYIETCVLGVRHYYHRDSPKTITKGRRIIAILQFVHYAAYAISFCILFTLCLRIGLGIGLSTFGATAALAFLIWL